MALIERNFRKFLRKENQLGKNSERGKSFDRGQAGECFKCEKTDHMIKDCPLWEIEWKKRREEKEKEEVGKNKETTKAMVVAWGSDDDSEDEADQTALMADIHSDSDMEEDIEMRTRRDETLSEPKSVEDQLLKGEKSRVKTEKENQLLKKQVAQLGSSILRLQYEVLKLTLEAGKRVANNKHLKVESKLKRVRRELQLEKEKSKDLSSRLLQTEHDLEKENRSTQASTTVESHKPNIQHYYRIGI
ncbi:uncharacterized protein LOC132066465 [Lycium ferocissimum]|uniref:uncharacterized protein LOC132066465 n=1 Tax=Lycium ferocissimum TaxID=112874 RepID=UPI0028165D64|nr:uncharacterized protein LOC132066465 [Lycium ferocissimum]